MKKIHFIGIGGIGVSALAQYFIKKGYLVSGSDVADSETVQSLKKLKAIIEIGRHKKGNVLKDIDLVIYSPAVEKDNPEILKALDYKIPVKSYPEALGEITKQYFTIAVSGTHGKSTTSTMIGLLLKKAKFDPTVIIGTKVKEFNNSNFCLGKSKFLVIEADEYQASFLNYHPQIIVLTNIEADHLDYYGNLRNIVKTFKKYTKNLKNNGFLVVNGEDKNILEIVEKRNRVKKYTLKQKEAKKIKNILKIPGKHNVYNSLAVLTVARILKIPDKISFKAISEYKGSWRRFEIHKIKVKSKPIIFIADYGHHPTEVKATLNAAREKYPNKKIWCVFQPHQYQRTFYLFSDFLKSFDKADEIVLTEIYTVKGRESADVIKKVSGRKLADGIKKRGKKVKFIKDFNKISSFLKKVVERGDVVIVMGAGDIYKIYKQF